MSFDLVQHPKVLATPHLGGNTIEAQLRIAKVISKQIVDASKGEGIVGLVSSIRYILNGKPGNIFMNLFSVVFNGSNKQS